MRQKTINNFFKYFYIGFSLFIINIKKNLNDNYFYFFWLCLEPLFLITIFVFLKKNSNFGADSLDYITFVVIGTTLFFSFIETVVGALSNIKRVHLGFKNIDINLNITLFYLCINNFFTTLIFFFLCSFITILKGASIINLIFLSFHFVIMFIFGTLIGLLISTLCILFNEIERVIKLLLRLALFASGVLFVINTKNFIIDLNKFNPLFLIIDNARNSYLNLSLNISIEVLIIILFLLPISLFNFYRSDKFLKDAM